MHVELLLRELKRDGSIKCYYCRQELEPDQWNSHWDHFHAASNHYKSVFCTYCNKKNWVRMRFIGSGHDPILKKNTEPIESIICGN